MPDNETTIHELSLPSEAELELAFPSEMARIRELQSQGLSFEEVGEQLAVDAYESAACDPERIAEQSKLVAAGFTQVDGWIWAKAGVTYDMTIADLDRLDVIEQKGTFVVNREAANG